jgi:asparagine synthase (glutamine-hydrolysing)
MCGIAGIVGDRIAPGAVQRMTDRLKHRGPDAEGLWGEPGVQFGHRRLSILDLSSAGVQPMIFGTYAITYNGEIYNFQALREGLEGPFDSNTDTEVLLKLYAAEGPSCVEKLNGMFAFAIWDGGTQSLFAARDRLGIKPFFYREIDGGIAFASEIKALLELGTPEIDRSALLDYFTYKYIPAPKTIYKGIRKLPPGHTLEFRDGACRVRKYWEPAINRDRRDPEETLAELGDLLADAVRSHTISDVPLGVFLSGGLDSSAMVACLDRPKTYSIGFDVEKHSELPFAREVADHFGTEHHEEIVSGVDMEEALNAIPLMYDEPFGDSSAWATYIVSREARKHVTVALAGDGGDEVFSGYGWYRKWFDYQTSGFARWINRIFDPFSSRGLSLYRRGANELERYAALVGPFTIDQKETLLSPDLFDDQYDHLWYFRQFWRKELDPLKRMQWLDLNTFLPDDILTKVDRASMAVSLEVRPPLLDHRLVEFALSFDSSLLQHGGVDKRMLRTLMTPKLPESITSRPKKGFSMPVRRWCEGQSGLLDRAFERLHEQGILATSKRPRLQGEQMWSLLVLDRWLQHGG